MLRYVKSKILLIFALPQSGPALIPIIPKGEAVMMPDTRTTPLIRQEEAQS
ncbi:MAG: hypothetical protein LUD79_08410 [Oscillospiraceae bacterium]|nr:hypothetical protein [Oscillospiraceae bacterium]